MFKYFFLCSVFLAIVFSTEAQSPKCGYDYLLNAIKKSGYDIKYRTEDTGTASKSTANEHYTIPVVFHVVLNQGQLNQLGGEPGLKQYIDAQLNVINKDFNALNSDTSRIPLPFKPLLGNMNISFALAHTTPAGGSTPGYEIVIITKTGFELDGIFGSTFGFSDSKYTKSGGLDTWDPSTYLNIWVINPLEKGSPTNILGLTISPVFAKPYKIPEPEFGITLNYKTWGNIANFRGRTLTHELGHYFELRHVWGDDDGKCPFNGGEDDGVEDTPPQAYQTNGCPSFPRFDNCSDNTTNGIMFNNFMDYTDDNCQFLFTKGQVGRMRSSLAAFASVYGLTQHPGVLDYPQGPIVENYIIYPNPCYGKVNIRFDQTSSGLEFIHIMNTLGQTVSKLEVKQQRGLYYFDLSDLGSGVYYMYLKFVDKSDLKKIVITRN